MESIFDKTDVDINSMLTNWGLMKGRYEDGVIKTNEFGIINMRFSLTLFAFLTIKYTILMFYHENSLLAIYLGEYMQYFSPKVFGDLIVAIIFGISAIFIMLFYFSSKNCKKMLFWLDYMQFDNETRCFHKLHLNESDSKRFTNQFALLWFIIQRFVYFLTFITLIADLISFLIFKNEYYFYYLTSIFLFVLGAWNFVYNWCALILILYQVNKKLIILLN